MSSWNIAVVGATGQVGKAFIELLAQSTINIDNIYLLASDNSEGETVRIFEKNITIQTVDNMDWVLCHLAFFVADSQVTQKYAHIAAESGTVVIDATGYYSQQPNIPLIVPKINDSVLDDYRNENIVAMANPIVCQALRSIAALTDVYQINQLHITNLASASFYGKQGVNELAGQSARLLNGLPAESEHFEKQIAFNLLPATKQGANIEKSVIEQIQRILGDYQLAISLDNIIVPVFYGMTQTVSFMPSNPIDIELNLNPASFEHFSIEFNPTDYPTPVTQVNIEQNEALSIHMANLRYSIGNQNQIQFTSVSDNVRFLGARLLIEIAGNLLNKNCE
ncbi:aspartate-semialdehyde dehydrogenase [Orbaceae bacterium ac157xtp]